MWWSRTVTRDTYHSNFRDILDVRYDPSGRLLSITPDNLGLLDVEENK